jgi:hypothetical protein
MADARNCEQCGGVFEPRREHERFCSARCRISWNSRHAGAWQAGDTALGWSVTAMADAAQRLADAGAMDLPHALAVISEAVWWITIVDATMIRYHREAYDRALTALDPAVRWTAEGSFAGLRFVRNQMGYHADPADFIEPQPGPVGTGDAPVTAWTWKPVSVPALGPVPQHGRTWELSRHRGYRAHLAGRPVGEVIARAAAFLCQLYGSASNTAGTSAPPVIRSAGA